MLVAYIVAALTSQAAATHFWMALVWFRGGGSEHHGGCSGRRCHLDARVGTGTRYSLISRGPYPSAISSPTEDLAGRSQTYAHAR